jgi:hypothetical protein
MEPRGEGVILMEFWRLQRDQSEKSEINETGHYADDVNLLL